MTEGAWQMASLVGGGYGSHDNVCQARQRRVKRAVFNKPSGLGLHEMSSALPGITLRWLSTPLFDRSTPTDS